MTIGKQIRALRESKGWSQPELADLCGVNRHAVSNWEIGLRLPSQNRLRFLERLAGVPDGTLVPVEKSPSDPTTAPATVAENQEAT